MRTEISYIKFVADRWSEEVKTAGNKTELTKDDVKQLEKYVDELIRIEATFADVVRRAEEFIAK